MQDTDTVSISGFDRDYILPAPSVGIFSREEAEKKSGYQLANCEVNSRQLFFKSEGYYPPAIGAIFPCDALGLLLPMYANRTAKAVIFFLPDYFETSLVAMASQTDEGVRIAWDISKRHCTLYNIWSASSRDSVIPLELWVNDTIFCEAFSKTITEDSEPEFLPIIFVTNSKVATGGVWMHYKKLCELQASSSTAINAKSWRFFTDVEIQQAHKTAELFDSWPWLRGSWRYDFEKTDLSDKKIIDVVYAHIFQIEPDI